jgi:hypothetical protein
MNLTELKSHIDRLSEDDMRTLNHYIVDTLRAEQKLRSALAKRDLAVGMRVRINHPKAESYTYIIEKISRTKAVMRKEGSNNLSPFGNFFTTAPLSLLEII